MMTKQTDSKDLGLRVEVRRRLRQPTVGKGVTCLSTHARKGAELKMQPKKKKNRASARVTCIEKKKSRSERSLSHRVDQLGRTVSAMLASVAKVWSASASIPPSRFGEKQRDSDPIKARAMSLAEGERESSDHYRAERTT